MFILFSSQLWLHSCNQVKNLVKHVIFDALNAIIWSVKFPYELNCAFKGGILLLFPTTISTRYKKKAIPIHEKFNFYIVSNAVYSWLCGIEYSGDPTIFLFKF